MTTRDRTVIMVLALLGLVAAFWFLLLAPKRDELGSLKDQLTAAQGRLSTADASAQTATAAKLRYARDYRTVASLGKAVPADDDVPSLVYELQVASHASKIVFQSIKLSGGGGAPAPTPATTAAQAAAVAQTGSATPPAATGAPATTPAATGSATPAAATVSPEVAAAQAAFAGLPPGASVGPAGLPTMPFDFEFTGRFKSLEGFLHRIDAFTTTHGGVVNVNGRLMTIDGISLSGFPTVTATIHATAFLLPDAEGLLNGATQTGPATAVPASSPTASAAPSATPVAAATTAGVTK